NDFDGKGSGQDIFSCRGCQGSRGTGDGTRLRFARGASSQTDQYLKQNNMIPLEDNVGDIIGKAQRGLGISDSELAERARLSLEKIRALREGDFDEADLMKVAPVLG